MKRVVLAVAALIVVMAVIGTFVVRGYLENKKEREAEGEKKPAPAHVSVEDGEVVVQLDAEGQEKAGLVATPLKASSHRPEMAAFGMVVEVQELADLRAMLASAKAQADRAHTSLDASTKNFERVKRLHADNRNASDKMLETAEAAFHSDEATAQAADEALLAARAQFALRWGSLDEALVTRLLKRSEVLVQLAFSGDAPSTGRIDAIELKLVGPSPRVDPRIQGRSFFYSAPAASGLLPGLSVGVRLPVGDSVQGVVLAASAVVWWQGKAWAYAARGKDKFVRREVAADYPVKDGWFVTKGFAAEESVVTTGAQVLLSEELRSLIQAAGE